MNNMSLKNRVLTRSTVTSSAGSSGNAQSDRGKLAHSSSYVDPTQDQLPDDSDYLLCVDVELVDFAVAAWGLDRLQAERIQNHSFVLDHDRLSKYLEICKTPGKRKHDLHRPFVAICDALLHDTASYVGVKPDKSGSRWDSQGLQNIGSAHGSSFDSHYRKASLSTTFCDVAMGSTWQIAKVPIEFKRDQSLFIIDSEDLADPDHDGTLLASSYERCKSPASTQDSKGEVRRAFSAKSTSSNQSSVLPAKPSSGQKRTLDEANVGISARSDSIRKKRRTNRALRDARIQLSPFAFECLNSTSRHYVVGLYIVNCEVNVVYFDRMRVLQTIPFDFRKDTGALALVFFGLNQCDRRHAGWDPLLLSSPSNTAGPLTEEGALRLTLPVSDLVGSYFEFHASADASVATQAFKITGIIRKAKELIGRATSVYRVREASTDCATSSEDLILKLTWPLRTCPSELDTILGLREQLPRGLSRHLPTVIAHTSLTPAELHLPWTLIPSIDAAHGRDQERVLRASVSDQYMHLWEADNLADFMQGWLDCVEVHYHAFKTGKILHRDLSENNLMLRRSKDGTIIGVLNDWDMSSRVDEAGYAIPSITNHLIGTLPFMAYQLVTTRKPKHAYRHDLESFFYILVWAAILYDLKAKTRGPMPKDSMLKDWTQPTDEGSLIAHSHAKMDFLEVPDTYESIFAELRPEYADLLNKWIKPLHALFMEAYEDEDAHSFAQGYDRSTCNGILTFETFMAAIGEKARSFKNVLGDA